MRLLLLLLVFQTHPQAPSARAPALAAIWHTDSRQATSAVVMIKFSLSHPGAHEAYVISWVSLVLTIMAFAIGLAVSAVSGSSATLGFALENAVDGISSALVLWRFWGGGRSIPEAELELREKRASVGIALAFVVLAITVGGTASAHLAEHNVPSNVAALLGISAPSVVVFSTLGAIKLHLGFATRSPSLKKDAACSLCGALLSLGVCIGTAVAHEAWYFDALVALLVSGALFLHGVYTLVKNGRSGNHWWAGSFWMVAPAAKRPQGMGAVTGLQEVAPVQMLEATINVEGRV